MLLKNGGIKMNNLGLIQKQLEDAGLTQIGLEMKSVIEVDSVGKDIEETLGLPLNVLKCFDSSFGVEILRNAAMREKLYKVYTLFPNCFEMKWNKYQCYFFEENYEYFGMSSWLFPSNLDHIFKMLGTITNDSEYYDYKVYFGEILFIADQCDFPLYFTDNEKNVFIMKL